MLNLNEVAQWLTEVFNEQSKNFDPIYTFNIYAEVGEDKNNVDVQGVLKVDIPKNVPVNKIVNVRYYGDIEFTVSAPRSNYNLANVEKIIGGVAKEINGTEKVFANGKGFVTMSVAGTGNFKTEYSQGNIVPLRVKLDINYSENVVTGGGKHWYIKELIGDYIEIPFITERVTIEKDGKVSPINDRAYKQAFMLAQQRSYMFTLPYDTTVGALITRDILKGDANKNYILKYIDGVAFTENDPFETQVVLYRNGDNGETKPDTAMLNIIFTDADDGNNETKYLLALIDNEFDGTTENTRWFDSITDQQAWFTTKIANGADYDSIDAPNLNNLVLTNQIYKNTRKYDIFDLVNKNYAVIKVIKGENEPQYYYYRVTNADIGANGQVIYTLRLDGVQTWLFRDNLIIDDSFISKAHLDRWIDNGDGTVTFNGNADSKLFEREEIRNVAKRLVKREKLKYYSSAGNYTLITPKPSYNDATTTADYYYKRTDGFFPGVYFPTAGISESEYNKITQIFENKERAFYEEMNKIVAWVYIFLDAKAYKVKTKNIKGNDYTDIQVTLDNAKSNYVNGFELPTAILCYPIGEDIDVDGGFEYPSMVSVGLDGWNNFVKLNPDETASSYIKGIKLSVKPPVNLKQYNLYDCTFKLGFRFTSTDVNADVIDINKYRLSVLRTGVGSIGQTGLFYLKNDYIQSVPMSSLTLLVNNTFNKSEIINSAKNKDFNPKLNSADFKDLTITIAGSQFNFPIDKINQRFPQFEYFEALTPETTRGLLRLGDNIEQNTNNAIFNYAYLSSFNGFNYSNDFTIAFAKNVYAEYIANNKNAYMSFQAQQDYARESAAMTAQYKTINYGISMGNQTANLGKQLATLNFGGAISTGQQMGVETAQYLSQISELNDRTNLNLNYNKTQFDLSIDNMKNAPNTLSSLNGNAILTQMIAEFGIYAEVYEGLDTELESANDMMFRDGYNLNRFEESGKSIRDYCHTRKYFNYIKATLGNIHGVPMSDTMRADLKERFANGIRFWHQDTIDYSMENYELNLVTE